MNVRKIMSLASAAVVSIGGLTMAAPTAVWAAEPITITGERNVDTLVERVSYSDLDLAQVQGERRLVQRVGYAVNRVCPDRDLATIDHWRTCRFSAWGGARPQIALAVERARQIALNGFSAIAPVAIRISAL